MTYHRKEKKKDSTSRIRKVLIASPRKCINVKAECLLVLACGTKTRRTVFKNVYKRLPLPPSPHASQRHLKGIHLGSLALWLSKNSSWVQTIKGKMLSPSMLITSQVIDNTHPFPCGPAFPLNLRAASRLPPRLTDCQGGWREFPPDLGPSVRLSSFEFLWPDSWRAGSHYAFSVMIYCAALLLPAAD